MPPVGKNQGQQDTRSGSANSADTNTNTNRNRYDYSDNMKRDGAQPTPDESIGTSCSLNLMAGYPDHDGSDIYGQVPLGDNTTHDQEDDVNPFDHWEEATRPHVSSHKSRSSLECTIHSIAAAQLRDCDDLWGMHILTKLHRIHLYSNSDVVRNISYINGTLRDRGLPRLHRTTLHALKTQCANPSLPQRRPSRELLDVLRDVAVITEKKNQHDWIHSVLYKLSVLGLTTVRALGDHIDVVNDLLALHRLPLLHSTTISAFVTVLSTKSREVGPAHDRTHRESTPRCKALSGNSNE